MPVVGRYGSESYVPLHHTWSERMDWKSAGWGRDCAGLGAQGWGEPLCGKVLFDFSSLVPLS